MGLPDLEAPAVRPTPRWRKLGSNFGSRLVEGPSRNCAIRPRGVARRRPSRGRQYGQQCFPCARSRAKMWAGAIFIGLRPLRTADAPEKRGLLRVRFASPMRPPAQRLINSDAKSLQAAPFEPDRPSPAPWVMLGV